MKKWLIAFCLLATGCACLSAQTVRIQNDELLKSGQYTGGSVDIIYTAPANYKVTAFINDKRQPEIQEKGAGKGTRKLTIYGLPELEYETTYVRLEFKDENGNLKLKKQYELKYKDSRQDLYVLSVGVGGDLSDKAFAALTFPKYDATNIRDCFRDYTKLCYKEKEFRLRCEPEETTLSSLRENLSSMVRSVGKGSVFMLYLSGHGEMENGEYYFISSDARKSNLAGTALSGSEIRRYLHQMAAKGALVYVFLDSCHAEALYSNDGNSTDAIGYFASCKAEERSAESTQWKNSVYAYALVTAINGTNGSAQVTGGGGDITIASLQNYLEYKVPSATHYIQKPVCHHPGLSDSQVIFKAPPVSKVIKEPETGQKTNVGQTETPPMSGEAAYREALRYQNGEGVNKNLVKAFQYMKIAAESGYVKAYHPLAKMYHGGRGVAKDTNQASKWYRKAADNGDKQAAQTLRDML